MSAEGDVPFDARPTHVRPIGPRPDEPDIAVLAARFPQLDRLELLGRGGMGVVYKARQASLDRWAALKLISSDIGGDADFTKRFAREARAMAKLNHPNIVSIYDFGDSGGADGVHYFLMEYVNGTNLRHMMRTGRCEPNQALAIIAQVCDALQYAHDEGIIHRDIKPENILIDTKGRVKIADFGLAKLRSNPSGPITVTDARQVMGTPQYMAPEQLERPGEVDHRADIYSTGVVLYELLTGELPIGRFPPPSQCAPLDARLDEIVLRSLEKEPQRRYQHASDLKTSMQQIGSADHPQVMASRLDAPTARGPALDPTSAPAVSGLTTRAGMATASLLCGLFGMVCVPFLGIVALILGIIALIRASRQPLVYGGKGLAIGGICTGVAGFFTIFFFVGMMLPAFAKASESSLRTKCGTNLAGVNQALLAYAGQNNQAFPSDLGELISLDLLSSADLRCPAVKGDRPDSAEPDYLYIGGQSTTGGPGDVLIYEPPESHRNKGSNVLFVDGQVKFIEPYSRVLELVKQTRQHVAESKPPP